MSSIAINQKYTLTIKEASEYFNIGQKKLRMIAEQVNEAGRLRPFALYSGNRYLIIRPMFEQYLREVDTI